MFLFTIGPHRKKDSASSVAKKYNRSDVFEDHPVYHYWLSLDIFKAFSSAQEQIKNGETTIRLTINKSEFEVSLEALETAKSLITNALEGDEAPTYEFGIRHSEGLANFEKSQTSVCAVALHDLIASPYGKIMHQGSTRKNPDTSAIESADYYGAVFSDNRICTPFLVGNGKLVGEFNQAVTQTGKYAHDVIEERRDGKSPNPVILGLPLTRFQISLYVFVLGAKKLWGMQSVKCATSNLAVYATVYAASHYMINNHRVEEVNLLEQPFLHGLCPLQAAQHCRVFREGDKVVKFFSHFTALLPTKYCFNE